MTIMKKLLYIPVILDPRTDGLFSDDPSVTNAAAHLNNSRNFNISNSNLDRTIDLFWHQVKEVIKKYEEENGKIQIIYPSEVELMEDKKFKPPIQNSPYYNLISTLQDEGKKIIPFEDRKINSEYFKQYMNFHFTKDPIFGLFAYKKFIKKEKTALIELQNNMVRNQAKKINNSLPDKCIGAVLIDADPSHFDALSDILNMDAKVIKITPPFFESLAQGYKDSLHKY